jgi:hypothetical protein
VGGVAYAKGSVYDCPFLPPEALRFITARFMQGVAVGNRNASADRAFRVRACARARVRSRVPAVLSRMCVCARAGASVLVRKCVPRPPPTPPPH